VNKNIFSWVEKIDIEKIKALLPLSVVAIAILINTGCSSSSSTALDKLFGSETPILTAIPNQLVAQGDLLEVDVNNIVDGPPGTDEGMTYTCQFDLVEDRQVSEDAEPCTSMQNATVDFNPVTGVLKLTPGAGQLGNKEIRIIGTNAKGIFDSIFTIGIRLKFNGISNITAVTGTTVTMTWTPNVDATSYQVFKLNSATGNYELFQTLTGAMTAGATLTGLLPNMGYTMRVLAIDSLGNSDGNVVSKTFTTTELTKFALSPATMTVTAGVAQTITVQAYNADGSLQTVGGLSISPTLVSGTTSGTFGPVTDHNNGTYTFTFTPQVVGTAAHIEITISMTFFIQQQSVITAVPAAPSNANSSLTISSNSVISNQTVSLNAVIRDQFNNLISGKTTIFSTSGGASTGVFSAVTEGTAGSYSATFRGVVAGAATSIRVACDGVTLSLSQSLAVTPGNPVMANSSLTTSVSTLTSGAAATLTATLRDINNNPVSSGIMVEFTKSGGTSSGSFGSITNSGGGVFTNTYTGYASGSAQTIGVSIDGSSLGRTVTITVVPGAVNLGNSSFVIDSPTVISSQFINLTATLKDLNNNPIESGITVSFAGSGGTSTGTLGSVSNQGSGVYTSRFTGLVAGTAKTLTVVVNSSNIALSQTVTVLPGAPVSANSTIGISSSTVVSGQSVTVTATLRDVNSNVVPTGILVGLTATAGTSTGNMSSVTNAGNGVYTATYTGIVSGSAQTISVIVDGVALGPTTSIQVFNGPALIGNSSLVTSSPTVISGSFVTVTASLRDLNNNPLSSGITVTFSKTGGTSTGTFSAVTNNGDGTYSIRYNGVTAGTAQTLRVLINAVDLGLTVTVAVNPGAPSLAQSSLTMASSVASGSAASITAVIRDDNSNPITSGILVTFTKSGGTSTGNLASVSNDGNGQYSSSYTGVVAGSAQSIGVSIDGVPMGLNSNITVVPGVPNNLLSTISVSSPTVIAGNAVTVIFTLRDGNSNPISAGYVVALTATGGTSTGTFSSVTNSGDGTYAATYTGNTSGTAQTLQATVDLAYLGGSTTITVQTGNPLAANSSLSITPASIPSGTSGAISATVRDSQNNPISSDITFETVGGTSSGSIVQPSYAGSAVWNGSYSAETAGSSQSLRVLFQGVPISGLTTSLQVIPGAINIVNSTFTTSSATLQSSTAATLTIQLRDGIGNRITGKTITFLKNSLANADGTIGVVSESPAGSGNYSTTYTATQQGSAQTLSLVVDGSTVVGMSVSISATAGPPSSMVISRSINATNPMNPTECLGPITVTLKDTNANTTSSSTPMSVVLSSPAWGSDSYHTGTIFSDANCLSGIATVDFAANVSSSSFYYKNYSPVTYNLTLDAPGAITDEVISLQTKPVLTWFGSSATPQLGGSGSFSAATELSNATSTGFSVSALGMIVVDNEMYVTDRGFSRIVKFDLTSGNPVFVGWVGGIAHKEGISAACSGQGIGAYTANWCTGGKSTNITVSGNDIRFDTLWGLGSDATYIYVPVTSRVWRVRRSDGQLDGWIGYATTGGGTCTLGTQIINAPTNGWCPSSVVHGSGSAGGQFNAPTDVTVMGGYLYITDYNNNRIQRWTTAGVYSGWIGRMSAAATNPTPAGYPANNPTDCTASGAAATVPWYTTQWCMTGTPQLLSKIIGSSGAALTTEGFYNPVSIDNDGTNIYVSDYSNARTVKFDPTALTSWPQWVGRVGHNATNAINPIQTNGNHTNQWSDHGYVEYDTSSPAGIASRWLGILVNGGYLYGGTGWASVNRIDLSNGQNGRWFGRAASTPNGGVAGCSTTPVMSVVPGWCTGGGWNRTGITNGSFGNEVRDIAIHGTNLYALDRMNARISRHNLSTGAFINWIGASGTAYNSWTTTQPSGSQIWANGGLHDYGFFSNWGITSIAPVGDNYYINDTSSGRIKRYNQRTGVFNGWTGRFSWTAGTIPTGGENCLGIVDGVTPEFCFGGYRSINDSSHSMHAYNNPMGIASDGTNYYISSWTLGRIDKYQISNSGYLGWTGIVSGIPTDGDAGCTTKLAGEATNGWCIGGSSVANNYNMGGFAESSGGAGVLRGLFWDSTMGPSGKLLAVDTSRLHVIGADGVVSGVLGFMQAAGATGCTVTNNAADQFCTSATAGGAGSSTIYGAINDPFGVWADSDYIYITDAHTIKRYTKTGAPAGMIGRRSANTGFVISGNCSGATFPGALPGWCNGSSVGVTIGAESSGSGNGEYANLRGIWGDSIYLYAADTSNNRVVRINKSTGAFAGWKGTVGSNSGMTGNCAGATVGAKTPGNYWCMGGSAIRSSIWGGFDGPTGVYANGDYLIVADLKNNRVMQVPIADGP
jgi:hypothetical protein